jgi:hypothetical protein
MSPKVLQDTIDELKSQLEDKNAPFGVDLALPQVGGNARKTNVCLRCLDWLTSLNHHTCSTITPTVSSASSWISLSPVSRSCSLPRSVSLQRK